MLTEFTAHLNMITLVARFKKCYPSDIVRKYYILDITHLYKERRTVHTIIAVVL